MREFVKQANQLPMAVGIIALLVIAHFFASELETPTRDQLRYIDYAYNLQSHEVFGLGCGNYSRAPQPGNANVPFYPILLSAASELDPDLNDEFYCALKASGVRGDCVIGTGKAASEPSGEDSCNGDYSSILVLHHILFFASLLLLFLISREIFNRPITQWLTLFAALLSGIFSDYVTRVLTENLLLTLFIALQYLCIRYFKQPGFITIGVMGVMLALLTLTRPEYPYLAVIGFLILLVTSLWRRELRFTCHALVFALAFSVLMSPWLVRNKEQFNSWAISAGNYGEITLAYRIAYNDMDAKHFVSAFVYFLPDFGDSLTRRAFPESWYWRENDDQAGSYQDITNQMLEATVSGELTLSEMIEQNLLMDLPKHLATTLPLAWRGVFIAKYWGLIAFFTYLVFQLKELRAGRYQLAIIALPTWILVGLHAGISINIPRYNLPLITIYSLSLAWLLAKIFKKRELHGE